MGTPANLRQRKRSERLSLAAPLRHQRKRRRKRKQRRKVRQKIKIRRRERRRKRKLNLPIVRWLPFYFRRNVHSKVGPANVLQSAGCSRLSHWTFLEVSAGD